MFLCDDFLLLGSDYLGGESDGYEYWMVFGGFCFESIYEMVW